MISERFSEKVERTLAHESNESGSESVLLLPGCHPGLWSVDSQHCLKQLEMQSWGPCRPIESDFCTDTRSLGILNKSVDPSEP